MTAENNKLTAGDKCALANVIFSKTGEGWTPATKILATTYIDLSEKSGYAFAGQWFLEFRTGLSQRTMNRANATLKASGLFEMRYLENDNLEVVPNLDRLREEWAAFKIEQGRVVQEHKDKLAAARRQVDAGSSDEKAAGGRQFGGHNHSIQSLPLNPSIQHSRPPSDPGAMLDVNDEGRQQDNGHTVHNFRSMQHRQTKQEADQALAEIRSAWPKPSKDAEHQPTAGAETAASIHYYKHLRTGIAASFIKRAAFHFLGERYYNEWPPSLARFLTRYFPDYLEPDMPQYQALKEEQPVGENDNGEQAERRVSAIE